MLYQSGIIKHILMKLSNIFSRRNRILLRELVVTDFKLRYQGSVLGYTWSILKPLFLFAIMYVVFGVLIKLDSVEHYPVYLLFGIVLWTFFAEATNQGLQSIVNRGSVIRKVSFPKYIIVISTTVSALVNLIINLGIVGIFMLLGGVQLHWSVLMLPFYIIEIYIIALGLAFFLSTLNVKYRDTSHIWEIIMQAAFYGTPILYPLTVIMAKSVLVAKVLMMNPIAQAIQDSRYSLVTHQTITVTSLFNNAWYMLIPLTITAVVFIFGALYFKKNSKYFAENV